MDVRRAGGPVWGGDDLIQGRLAAGIGGGESWQAGKSQGKTRQRQGKTRQGRGRASRDSANVLLARRMGGCSSAIKHEELNTAVKPTGEILLPTESCFERKTLDD